ncbi:uncharacterized protein KRP23_14535 [Phytophthora ramorum]|uniref:uncharacterized protein n=1 Tax=Phytophthora ramorum TaxID=164328 RepID=UPI0030B0C711|nr:hypothetical protein KRP23_14535 [Phytophthora ramorum]
MSNWSFLHRELPLWQYKKRSDAKQIKSNTWTHFLVEAWSREDNQEEEAKTTADLTQTLSNFCRALARANGGYDRAIKFYSRLTAARPSEIEAKFHLAVCLERTGQFAPALAAYKQVQKLSGGQHAFAYYNMGNLCMRAERVQQAIDYFSRAITTSKLKETCSGASGDNVQNSGSSIGPTPVVFYRQRAAAYRKNGDFEKAAQDYVLIQRCVGVAPPTATTQQSENYTAAPLYQLVKRTAPPKTENSQEITRDDDERERETPEELHDGSDRSQQDNDQAEETEDSLTTWETQRNLAIARLPPSERSDRDLQYLVDFMQKRFSVCSALHPDVCRILCRELVVSPEGRLPAKTPIFLEQDEGAQASDNALYFIFQGRVSISKTSGRMFQSSPLRPDQAEDVDDAQEIIEEDERCEQDAWESPWNSHYPSVSTDWKQSQLELCELEHGEVFGHQGRFTAALRAYSAVTTTTCVIGALSWHQWSRIDRAQHEAEVSRATFIHIVI